MNSQGVTIADAKSVSNAKIAWGDRVNVTTSSFKRLYRARMACARAALSVAYSVTAPRNNRIHHLRSP